MLFMWLTEKICKRRVGGTWEWGSRGFSLVGLEEGNPRKLSIAAAAWEGVPQCVGGAQQWVDGNPRQSLTLKLVFDSVLKGMI